MIAALERIAQLDISYNTPLAPYTAARMGGPADILAVARSADALLRAIQWAYAEQQPWLVLGGGANVLISDAGVRGLVVINKANAVSINEQHGVVVAESGTSLIQLARRCMKRGLKGLEWCVSVPGSVGGAVINNAGAHGADMNSNLHSTSIFDVTTDTQSTWTRADMRYDYRYSALKGLHGRYVVLSATLVLSPGHVPEQLTEEANEYSAYRKRTQPPGASMGSVFKNPPDDYAGRLIEAAGLKGYRIGGVQVSPVHANFFVNDDNATATAYFDLIQHVQAAVQDKFGVRLILEIEPVGDGFTA